MKFFRWSFIIGYIGILLFCIFNRIESWPFSDYRLFSGSQYPQDVEIYAPYFELSNGKYFNPGTKKLYLHIDRDYFNNIFYEFESKDVDKYIKQLILSKPMQKVISEMVKEGLRPIKFIAMEVKFKKQSDKTWTPILNPRLEYVLY